LGDGTSSCAQITTADGEIVMMLEGEGLVVTPSATAPMCYSLRFPLPDIESRTVKAVLRSMGILGNEHIPPAYLRASESQRRALLAGLLDTDGTVTNGGCPQFTTPDSRLMEDVYELIVGLGYRCGVSRKPVKGRSVESSTAFTLTFSADEDVFRLGRKALLHKERRGRTFQRHNSRFITAVRPV